MIVIRDNLASSDNKSEQEESRVDETIRNQLGTGDRETTCIERALIGGWRINREGGESLSTGRGRGRRDKGEATSGRNKDKNKSLR